MAKPEDNNGKDVIEVDLAKLGRYLLSHVWFAIICVVICATVGFSLATFVIPKEYQSSALFYVNNSTNITVNNDNKITNQDLSASKELVDTYLVILKSNTVLDRVVEESGLSYTRGQLKSMISASAKDKTEVFAVNVRSRSAKDSTTIANAICRVLLEKIPEIMENTSVKIVDYASYPTAKCYPSVKTFVLVGGIIGLLIGIVILIISSLLDNLIRDKSDIEAYSNLPILAMIPNMAEHGRKGYYYNNYYYKKENNTEEKTENKTDAKTEDTPEKKNNSFRLGDNLGFAASEAYKLFRTNLYFSNTSNNDKCKIYGITSAIKGEGKSTTSLNLALSLAESGDKVALLECDLRLPTLHKKLEINSKPGLSNLIVGRATLEETIQSIPQNPNLKVITAGNIPPNPNELLNSQSFKNVLDTLKTQFNYVIVDLPPVLDVSDALLVAGNIDGLIVVVRKDYCVRNALREALNQMSVIEDKLLGFVMNCASLEIKQYAKRRYRYGYKYGYKYGYRYGYKYGRYGYGYGYGYDGYGYYRHRRHRSDKDENKKEDAPKEISKEAPKENAKKE